MQDQRRVARMVIGRGRCAFQRISMAIALASMMLIGTPLSLIHTAEGDVNSDEAEVVDIHIEFDDPEYSVNAPQYDLPLSSAPSYMRTPEAYLTSDQRDYLSEHGYVNAGKSRYFDLSPIFEHLYEEKIPAYITTDTVLHIYHILFDRILSSVEEEYLYGSLKELTAMLMAYTEGQYKNVSGTLTLTHYYNTTVNYGNGKSYRITETVDLQRAALYNLAYLSVAMRLLDPNATIPSAATSLASSELELIDAASAIVQSPLFDKTSDSILEYQEDYSQYIPRGHYTRSETLERFFKAMMWYGRMTFRAKSAQETVQAILLSDALARAKTGSANAISVWRSIYDPLSFFVGEADDPTFPDYRAISLSVFGDLGSTYSKLLNGTRLLAFLDNVSKLERARICSGYYVASNENGIDAFTGSRMLGQRFVPDSELFTELVYPAVKEYTGSGSPFTITNVADFGQTKGLPRGTEAMAMLGSQMAEDYLIAGGDTDYRGYGDQFGKMEMQFDAYNTSVWGSSLYYGWLYALKPLAQNFSSMNYPSFMRDRGYQAEKLNTMLGSWTALRHDTILHVKQSYAGGGLGSPNQAGYVEPIPELYSRLFDLANATRSGLCSLSIMPTGMDDNLVEFLATMTRLKGITLKELSSTTLSAGDLKYIREFAGPVNEILEGIPPERYDVRIVADVHTDPNPSPPAARCLEEATGYFDYIAIAYEDAYGFMQWAIGPVYSYYEFTEPISNRLKDEAWRAILEDGTDVPGQFDWMDVPPSTGGVHYDIRDVGIAPSDMKVSLPAWTYNGTVRVEGRVSNFGDVDANVSLVLSLSSVSCNKTLMRRDVRIPFGEKTAWQVYWNVLPLGRIEQRFTLSVKATNFKDMCAGNDRMSCVFKPSDVPDADWDGHLDEDDAFPYDPAASIDSDGDGHPDRWNIGMNETDSIYGLTIDAYPFDPDEWADSDGDGVGDNSDPFPRDPEHWRDSDGDGVPEDEDAFPSDPSASVDTDGDGYPDAWNRGKSKYDSNLFLEVDAFPEDPTEWADTDQDGVGDNTDVFPGDRSSSIDTDGDGHPDRWNLGMGPEDSPLYLTLDAFPFDPFEWNDTDGDDVGDNTDAFPEDPLEWRDTDRDGVGDRVDLFPTDPAASVDNDMDGYPDRWNKGMTGADSTTNLLLDLFPMDPNEWADSDGDGIGDNGDAFPIDPYEYQDSDGDGYGDVRDRFPFDASDWNDTDGDGVGDNADRFPGDPSEWSDLDGDGVGDRADAFPSDPAASLDSDHDGYPDRWNLGRTGADSRLGLKLDRYPFDPAKWSDGDGRGPNYVPAFIISGLFLSLIVLAGMLYVLSRRTNRDEFVIEE